MSLDYKYLDLEYCQQFQQNWMWMYKKITG
jgi:hypothetical protein